MFSLKLKNIGFLALKILLDMISVSGIFLSYLLSFLFPENDFI